MTTPATESSRASAAQAVLELLRRKRGGSASGGRNSPLLVPARWVLRGVRRRRDRRHARRIARAQHVLQAENIVRPVPEFRGSFELELRNNLTQRVLSGRFESSLVKIFEAALRPGDHAIDVGANVGLYTVLAAQLVGAAGRVLAAEPVPTMLHLLRANVARNHLEQVHVFGGAVTSQEGPVSIEFVEGGEEYSSIGAIAHPDVPDRPKRQIQVPGESLDGLVVRHGLAPSFVKVDTEGAEGYVFSGARRVLEEHRPIIASELDDRLLAALAWDAPRVIALLAESGYKTFDEGSGVELAATAMPAPFIGEIVALPAELCR